MSIEHRRGTCLPRAAGFAFREATVDVVLPRAGLIGLAGPADWVDGSPVRIGAGSRSGVLSTIGRLARPVALLDLGRIGVEVWDR